jgi:thiamine-phosphate pyrophosphorylase
MSLRHKKHSRKNALPKIWLMTDPRFGDDLPRAIRRLPFGSGVIFRHYDLEKKPRRTLFRAVRKICRRRGHMLLLASDARTAMIWGADGIHSRTRGSTPLIHSIPVHDIREIAQARLCEADMMMLSPVFATASHPSGRSLGILRFMQLARLCGDAKVIALGGMSKPKGMLLDPRLIHGWAAIDAFR